MKRPFRERWLIAWMYWAEYRQRYERAMARLEELERRRPLETKEQAFKAYLLLRTMKPDDAHALFLAVRDEVRGRSDAPSRYLTHYCQCWLAVIRRDPFNERRQSRDARKVECDPQLKRLLWVPNFDRPDPLDAEFDAWMKANSPVEEDLLKRRRRDA